MIPPFHRPVTAFALCAIGAGCWLAAGALFIDALLARAELSGVTVPALILLAVGLPLFGLGRIVEYTAQSAHYLKYICWENRIANQLVEKKKAEPKPPPDLSHLEPIERIYHSVDISPP